MRHEDTRRTDDDRPLAALAMVSGVEQQLLSEEARRELDALVELVDPSPVDLTALPEDVLGRVEIVLGSWGCNLLDDALLACMPKLRLLAYAAGTVKHTVTPATWDHGVVVSSAAAANAVPVAEFTFAAIVMVAKDVFRARDALRETRGRAPVTGVGPAGALGTLRRARRVDRRVDHRTARDRTAAHPRRRGRGGRPVLGERRR